MTDEPGRLTIDGNCFRDRWGRSVLLRGLNVGGDCKVPTSPDGHTYVRTDFSDHRASCSRTLNAQTCIGRNASLAPRK